MMTLYFMIAVFMLTASSKGLKTTCEIPSVESGEEATLTTYFSEDLSNATTIIFIVLHQTHGSAESEMLSCRFNNGRAECDKTSCCTWERQVTNVFRVYIRNVSQEHEGKFWGVVLPAEGKDQAFCTFSLKASTCSTVFINTTNSHMTCNDRTVAIGQTCTVTCSPNHYFLENQTSLTYTCVGKNKWSPGMYVTVCEVYTCSADSINVTNSYVLCSNRSVTIGKTCTVTCNSGHYFEENRTSVTYTCVGKNKWYPEMTVISCEEELKDQKTNSMLLLLLLLFPIPVVTVILILLKRRHNSIRRRRKNERDEVHLSLLKSTNMQLQQTEVYWLRCIRTRYPEFQSKTYFFPTFHCAENRMLMPHTNQDYVHGGRALQRVLQCLRILADNHQQEEVMMIVSQLHFGMHLGKPSFVAVALLSSSSTTLEQFCQKHYDQGDSDVLIIHRTLGLLTLEIKSVGENFNHLEMTEEEQDDVVIEKIKLAIKQLNDTEIVLKHLTSDIPAITHINKIIALPNISSSQLLRAMDGTPEGKILCQCIGVQDINDAIKLCLLSNQLADIEISRDVNNIFSQALNAWWQQVASRSRPQPLMTSSVYEQIVARFCGPVTMVHCITVPSLNIHSLGEVVSEIGKRVYKLALFPDQVDILNQSPPRAFLSGPPGTGKTVVLILQGLTWLQLGYSVHVVSTRDKSRAATFVIECELQEIFKNSKTNVHRHVFDFQCKDEVKTAVRRLESMSKLRQLCMIADEAIVDDRKTFAKFCDLLIKKIPKVCIWGASVFHGVRPLCLKDFKLTTPLRSPQVVVREVMKSRKIGSEEIVAYTKCDIPVLKEGPPVITITHREGLLNHTGKWPRGCAECGHQVAHVLTDLKVGRTVSGDDPLSLQYHDVLVLCVDYSDDDRVDSNGQVNTKASGLVRGLRDCHVPLRVVGKSDEAAIRDMALGVGNLVTVARWDDVHGLERKVVIVESGNDWFHERLYAMSRCTLQLVVIHYESAL